MNYTKKDSIEREEPISEQERSNDFGKSIWAIYFLNKSFQHLPSTERVMETMHCASNLVKRLNNDVTIEAVTDAASRYANRITQTALANMSRRPEAEKEEKYKLFDRIHDVFQEVFCYSKN